MPRRRSQNKASRLLKEVKQPVNVLQTNRAANDLAKKPTQPPPPPQEADPQPPKCFSIEGVAGIKSLLDDENCAPSTSSTVDNFSTKTEALYNELDTFRLRWRRELQEKTESVPNTTEGLSSCNRISENNLVSVRKKNTTEIANHGQSQDGAQSIGCEEKPDATVEQDRYTEAKRLFLVAVEMEQDEMHLESIRFYKQAMHLCPDIEQRIFREQCQASAKAIAEAAKEPSIKGKPVDGEAKQGEQEDEELPLYDRIRQLCHEDQHDDGYRHCKPASKVKGDSFHISDLPHDLIMQICRYVIGDDLDLASLESLGLVCRGFYLLSKDPSLWRSICYSTWGHSTLDELKEYRCPSSNQVAWRQMYMERPRMNYDGVYVSRTRYVRQGDVGFQDITYRPFHVIRYYRYLRFFPDGRVLILTTNEEPDKIIPIFRHALHSKHFSPELSILEGSFEFTGGNQISIVAEKNCRLAQSSSQQQVQSQRRQAQHHWSRQTPLTQKFNMRFKLKTADNRPYKNNLLKWLDYSILTRLETGQEITSFDLSPETFPNLAFVRVKRFNLRLARPLSSNH